MILCDVRRAALIVGQTDQSVNRFPVLFDCARLCYILFNHAYMKNRTRLEGRGYRFLQREDAAVIDEGQCGSEVFHGEIVRRSR